MKLHLRRRQAERRYFKLDKRAGRLLWGTDFNDRAARISALRELSGISRKMAKALEIFDNDRTDEYGFTPAEWTRSEAVLYELALVLDLSHTGAGLAAKNDLLLDLHDATVPFVGVQAAEALASLAHAYASQDQATCDLAPAAHTNPATESEDR